MLHPYIWLLVMFFVLVITIIIIFFLISKRREHFMSQDEITRIFIQLYSKPPNTAELKFYTDYFAERSSMTDDEIANVIKSSYPHLSAQGTAVSSDMQELTHMSNISLAFQVVYQRMPSENEVLLYKNYMMEHPQTNFDSLVQLIKSSEEPSLGLAKIKAVGQPSTHTNNASTADIYIYFMVLYQRPPTRVEFDFYTKYLVETPTASRANLLHHIKATNPRLGEGTNRSNEIPGKRAEPSWESGASAEPSWESGASAEPSGESGASAEPSWESGASAEPSWESGASAEPSWESGASAEPSGESGASAEPSWESGASAEPSWESGASALGQQRDVLNYATIYNIYTVGNNSYMGVDATLPDKYTLASVSCSDDSRKIAKVSDLAQFIQTRNRDEMRSACARTTKYRDYTQSGELGEGV
jgi:hypothetical protein